MIKDNKDFDFFETLGGHPVFLFVNKFIAKGVLFLTAVVSPALISFVILRIGTGDWPVASETGVFIYVMGVCGGILASMGVQVTRGMTAS